MSIRIKVSSKGLDRLLDDVASLGTYDDPIRPVKISALNSGPYKYLVCLRRGIARQLDRNSLQDRYGEDL